MSREERARSFLFDPARFVEDEHVSIMSSAAAGAYVRLFCRLWHRPEVGVVPDHDPLLAALSQAGEQWATLKPEVAGAFDTTSRPGFWIQRGLIDTKKKQDAHIERQRSAGRLGGKSRWGNAKDRVAIGSLKAAHGEPKAPGVLGSRFSVESTPTASTEPSLREAPAPPDPVIEIPTIHPGTQWPIGEAMVAEWGELFPAVDVPQTLREIRAWSIANPTRRKTPRGMPRFITAWLSREQNRG